MIPEQFQHLAATVAATVDALRAKERLKCGIITYFRRMPKEFAYTDQGVETRDSVISVFKRRDWSAIVGEILPEIQNCEEYNACRSFCLTTASGNTNVDIALEHVAARLIRLIVAARTSAWERQFPRLFRRFLIIVREGPSPKSVKVELRGLIMGSPLLRFTSERARIFIRPSNRNDLTIEMRSDDAVHFATSHCPRRNDYPSAILRISLARACPRQLQQAVEEAIAILRLFRLAGIEYIRYRMISPSDTFFGEEISEARYPLEGQGSYTICPADSRRLRLFWKGMSGPVKQSLLRDAPRRIESSATAFGFYNEALRGHDHHKKTAFAIMGLEALLLPGADGELSYRFGTRLAKLLGLCGGDPHRIRRLAKLGYSVRSAFAHGGHLSREDKKKIDKEGGVGVVATQVLDYLRRIIVTVLTFGDTRDNLIALLDESLVDSRKDAEIRSKLRQAISLLG